MRTNLTKKDLVNIIYTSRFSKQISEYLIDEFFSLITLNLKRKKKLKLTKFGTFFIRSKKSRIGRNPKTKEDKIISERNVVYLNPLKNLKNLKF